MSDASAPTPEQVEAARLAGWDVGAPGEPGYPIAPPDGWVHDLPPAEAFELGNNGVPAPAAGDPDHPEREARQP